MIFINEGRVQMIASLFPTLKKCFHRIKFKRLEFTEKLIFSEKFGRLIIY